MVNFQPIKISIEKKVLANRCYHVGCVEQSEASEVQNNKQSVHLFTDGLVRDGQNKLSQIAVSVKTVHRMNT